MIRYEIDDILLDAGDLGYVPVSVTAKVTLRGIGYYDIEIEKVIAFFPKAEVDVTTSLAATAHVSLEEEIEKQHQNATSILGEGA